MTKQISPLRQRMVVLSREQVERLLKSVSNLKPRTAWAHTRISYNSCRNRHCPKCQWRAAERWLAARAADVLPVPYYHVVFTLPAEAGAIAYQNKAAVYGLLFKAAAQTLTTIAADPKHLGAEIGLTAVLHTWGQNLDHHPHVHCIVPGGGVSPDGGRWIGCRPGFFLPVLSRLFRRLFLDGLSALHAAGALQFFGDLAMLADRAAFLSRLAPLCNKEWVVFAKRPFAGPQQVLAYLSRYTHRVAIGNSRLVELTDEHVAFRWKDYRENGRIKHKTMKLAPASSFADSCFTSCPTASTAFATTAFSPTAIALTNWRCAVDCSARRMRASDARTARNTPTMRRPSRSSRRRVRAAAGE